MGEGKRRAALRREADREKAAWSAGLSERDLVVLGVAERILHELPLEGACYHLSIFLAYHLARRHSIKGEVVVGYINDGTDEIYSGHAWYEIDGRMTDLAICRPQHDHIANRGPVTILGYQVAPGWPYMYHRQRPPEGTAAILQFMKSPDPLTRQMEAETEGRHSHMAAVANNMGLMRNYLDGDPDGRDYETLAAFIDV